jgi:hypothetical protein
MSEARTRNRTGTIGAAALALIVVLLLASAGRAMAAWNPPATVTPNGEEQEVAADPSGNAVAVWVNRETGYRIEAASKAPGGAWGSAVGLSRAGRQAEAPQVAMDEDGNAIAVWSRQNGADRQRVIEAALKPAGGAWEEAVAISFGGRPQGEPQIAFDPAGDATAVWERENPEGLRIIQSATKPAGGAWQTPVNVSTGGSSSEQPQIALDGSGNAVAVWSRSTVDPASVVQAASKTAGGHWQAPITLSAGGPEHRGSGLKVEFDPAGNAIAVWTYRIGEYPDYESVIQSSRLPVGGAWSQAVDISAQGGEAFSPELAIDGGGNALAIFRRVGGDGSDFVQVASRPAGSAWGAPQNLSTPGQEPSAMTVGFDEAGDAIAAWESYVYPRGHVESRRMAPGGLWQGPVVLSAPEEDAERPRLAVAKDGRAVTVWTAGAAVTGAEYEPSGGAGEPPQITVAPNVTPTLWGGGGGTSTISVSATDEAGIARAFAKVTNPDGSEGEIPLASAGGDRYAGSFAVPFNVTVNPVHYQVAVYVEDTAGRIAGATGSTIVVEPKPVPNPGYLVLEPSTVKFGATPIAPGNPSRYFILRNPGKPASPTVTGTLESTDPMEFPLLGSPEAGLPYSLAPGESKTFRVFFEPAVIGQRQAQIKLNRTDNRQQNTAVLLFGQGVE